MDFEVSLVTDLDLIIKDELYPGICRCCLANGLFKGMLDGSPASSDGYAKILLECYNLNIIKMAEGFDLNQMYLICESCIRRLHDSYQFKLQVMDSQKAFDATEKENCLSKADLDFDASADCDMTLKSEVDNEFSETDDEPLLSMSKRHKTPRLTAKVKLKVKTMGKRKADDLDEKEFLLGMDRDNLQCKICLEIFNNFHLLNRHMNVHYPNHICEVCGKGHATRLRLRRHRIVHTTGHFTCEECGKTFTTKSKFENHRAVHILPLRHMCAECPERFSTFLKRQRHLQVAHNRDIYNYKCDYCDKVFPTSANLTNHRKRVHLKVKNHTCQFCGKSFFDGKAFREHSVVHSGERSHQCDVCLKSYGRLRTLKLHMKTHGGSLKQFSCNVCEQRFAQKNSLKSHMKVHIKFKRYH